MMEGKGMSDEEMSLFEEWWALDGQRLYSESRIDVLRIWAAGYGYGQQAERERCAKIAENEKVEIVGLCDDVYNNACNDIADAIREGWTV